jgi:hypothetical protein
MKHDEQVAPNSRFPPARQTASRVAPFKSPFPARTLLEAIQIPNPRIVPNIANENHCPIEFWRDRFGASMRVGLSHGEIILKNIGLPR